MLHYNNSTLAGETSFGNLTGDLFTGEVVGGRREPGKRLAQDPDVASSSIEMACSICK